MSDFSEKFRTLVGNSGYSTYALAKKCNIERTLLHRYGTGERLPQTLETIFLLSDRLMLSSHDTNELVRLWNMERIGKNVYVQCECIKELLENLSKVTKWNPSFKNIEAKHSMETIPPRILFHSTMELEHYLRIILDFESQKKEFKIQLCMQPSYAFLTNTLLEHSQKRELSVTQLICFNRQRDSIHKNAQYMTNILPLVFHLSNYEAKVYYNDAEQHINPMSILPNLIITAEFILLFSLDADYGIIYHDSEMHDFYSAIFSELSNNCKTINKDVANVEEYMQLLLNKNLAYMINENPCFGISLRKEFLDQVVKPDVPYRELLIEMTEVDILKRTEEKKIQATAFFTNAGMTTFLETGRDNEFPPELYRPLTMEERKYVVNRTCHPDLQDYIHNHLIHDDSFHFQSDMTILVETAGGSVIIQKPAGLQGRKTVIFEESSINEMFTSFFENAETMHLVESFEASLFYMKKSVAEN